MELKSSSAFSSASEEDSFVNSDALNLSGSLCGGVLDVDGCEVDAVELFVCDELEFRADAESHAFLLSDGSSEVSWFFLLPLGPIFSNLV